MSSKTLILCVVCMVATACAEDAADFVPPTYVAMAAAGSPAPSVEVAGQPSEEPAMGAAGSPAVEPSQPAPSMDVQPTAAPSQPAPSAPAQEPTAPSKGAGGAGGAPAPVAPVAGSSGAAGSPSDAAGAGGTVAPVAVVTRCQLGADAGGWTGQVVTCDRADLVHGSLHWFVDASTITVCGTDAPACTTGSSCSFRLNSTTYRGVCL